MELIWGAVGIALAAVGLVELARVARLQWMGWPGCRLVCLNPGEDPNVEAICNIFQRRYPNLELCKCPELVYDKENEKS